MESRMEEVGIKQMNDGFIGLHGKHFSRRHQVGKCKCRKIRQVGVDGGGGGASVALNE